jgi:hypothetical protein
LNSIIGALSYGGPKAPVCSGSRFCENLLPLFYAKKKELIISSFALKIITFVYAILKISAPDYLLERGNLHYTPGPYFHDYYK